MGMDIALFVQSYVSENTAIQKNDKTADQKVLGIGTVLSWCLESSLDIRTLSLYYISDSSLHIFI